MTRREIVTATYDVAAELNEIKRRHGLIDELTYAGVAQRLHAARLLLDQTDFTTPLTREALELANHGTMFGDDEMKWPVRHGFRVGPALVQGLASGLFREVGHTVARLAGHFDCAPLDRTY
jgi:hypothetical protein